MDATDVPLMEGHNLQPNGKAVFFILLCSTFCLPEMKKHIVN